MVQRVRDQLVKARERRHAVLGPLKVAELTRVLAPDLARPKDAPLVNVLAVVADDVYLLEEEAHRVGEALVLANDVVFHARLRKELGEADADEARHVVAVEIPLGLCHHFLVQELAHAGAHPLGNVGDRLAVQRLEREKLGDDLIKLNEQDGVLFVGPALAKRPARLADKSVEFAQQGDLAALFYCHVVLNRVQAAKNQVENADCGAQIAVQALDDSGEAAAREIQQLVAARHRRREPIVHHGPVVKLVLNERHQFLRVREHLEDRRHAHRPLPPAARPPDSKR